MTESKNPYTRPNEKRLIEDLVSIAESYLSIIRCPSGRPVVKGYICTHCGIDYGDWDNGNKFCGQPVTEDGYNTFNAAEARRIMQESEKKHD